MCAATTLVCTVSMSTALWSIGPCGVGQSLTFHLIASAFGRNHTWVDMHMYFTDDEMRKHAGQSGVPVQTGV